MMLEDIKLLLKYNMLLDFGSRGKRIRGIKGYLISMFVMSFVFYTVFSKLFDVSSIEVGGVDPLKTSMLLWSTFMNLMFLMGSIGGGVYVLSMNEELEFLLTLPIRRSSLALYQLMSVVIFQLPFGGIYLPVLMIYSKLVTGSPVMGILAFSIHFPTVIFLGILVSVSFARKVSRSMARRAFILLQILEILPVFLITNISSSENLQEILEGLRRITSALSKPYNVLAYGAIGLENPTYLLICVVLLFSFYRIFLWVSEGMSFEVVRGYGSGVGKSFSPVSRGYSALLRKDLKAFFRNEMTFFYLLYPYAFGIFMGWNSKDPAGIVIIPLVLSSMYTYNEAISVTVPDVLYWDLFRTLPVSVKRMIAGKVLLPVSINTALMSSVIVVSWIARGFSAMSLVLLVVSVLYYTMSSLMGVRVVLKNPPKSENPGSVYKVGSFIDSLVTMGLGALTVIGIGALNSGKSFGWLILLASLSASVVVIFWSVKSVRFHLKKLEEAS